LGPIVALMVLLVMESSEAAVSNQPLVISQ
jgi:hypothetical protein